MIENAERCHVSAVAIGPFAPRVYHPSWFSSYGLLGKNEVEASLQDPTFLVHEQIANFKVGLFEVQVRPDRLQIATSREDQIEPVRDLFQGVLQVVEKTPVSAIGFNWSVAFKMASEPAWHASGDRLVPKDLWKKLWPGQHIGMQELKLLLPRADAYKGAINVTIQPASDMQYGVSIQINDHFDFTESDRFDSSKATEFVAKAWKESLERSRQLMSGIYEECVRV